MDTILSHLAYFIHFINEGQGGVAKEDYVMSFVSFFVLCLLA